jgi:hypothetical protein
LIRSTASLIAYNSLFPEVAPTVRDRG